MKLFQIKINIFEIIYFFISVATFQHTVWSGSFSFNGALENSYPDFKYYEWHIAGILLAITIDVGMFICARLLAKRFSPIIALAFFVAAVVSFYMQLIYMSFHATDFSFGSGVSDYWIDVLQPFIDARVLIVPASLPVFGLLYSFAKRNDEKIRSETSKPSALIEGKEVTGEYFEFNGYQLEKFEVDDRHYVKIPNGRVLGPYKSFNYMVGALSRKSDKNDE